MIIKQKRYLIKKNSYIIDLFSVDFITWKENENEEGTYWTKLHIGTKEVRYVCQDVFELFLIVQDAFWKLSLILLQPSPNLHLL